MAVKLFACASPREPHWQIDAPPEGCRVLLLGWCVPASDTNGGIPGAVANMLARALSSMAKVTFATDSETAQSLADKSEEWVDLSRTGFIDRIASNLRGDPTSLALVATSRATVIVHAFSDAGFSWELGAQRLVLRTASSSGLPSRDAWLRLLRKDARGALDFLSHADTLGVVQPGVDGAVAALFCKSPAVESAFNEALAEVANDMRASYELLTEEAFASALTSSSI